MDKLSTRYGRTRAQAGMAVFRFWDPTIFRVFCHVPEEDWYGRGGTRESRTCVTTTARGSGDL
jgi:hypothetical protein